MVDLPADAMAARGQQSSAGQANSHARVAAGPLALCTNCQYRSYVLHDYESRLL